jgi:flagellar protein FliO/FliZ
MTDIYWRFVAALLVVVALIFAASWLVRRLGLAGRYGAARGKERRLSIVEVLPLDAKRRLVLLQRDQTQHLLLLGLHDDIVIEHGIAAPAEFKSSLKDSPAEPRI